MILLENPCPPGKRRLKWPRWWWWTGGGVCERSWCVCMSVTQIGSRWLTGRWQVVRCVFTRGLRRPLALLMLSGWWPSLSTSFISTANIIRSVTFMCVFMWSFITHQYIIVIIIRKFITCTCSYMWLWCFYFTVYVIIYRKFWSLQKLSLLKLKLHGTCLAVGCISIRHKIIWPTISSIGFCAHVLGEFMLWPQKFIAIYTCDGEYFHKIWTLKLRHDRWIATMVCFDCCVWNTWTVCWY